MKFLSSFGISSSGLTAQRMRMDVIAQNIANATSTRTSNGGPYRRKIAVLKSQDDNSFDSFLSKNMGSNTSAGGVRVSQVVEDKSPFKIVHDPSHPDADKDGNVKLPNIDTTQEMVDMMSATRAYESNITALNSFKEMAKKALEIGS